MMSTELRRDGLYATYRGAIYSANRDTAGGLVITTDDSRTRSLGFVDRYSVGTYTMAVDAADLTELFRVTHHGTFRGERLALTVNARGRVRAGTADPVIADLLGLPRVDKGWFELDVAPDDPRLVITEKHETVDGSNEDAALGADRYFVQFDADRVPTGMLRRHYTPGGHVDQVLRDVDDWKSDASGSVRRAIVNALESDLEEISREQATEFVGMVAARSYKPFPSDL